MDVAVFFLLALNFLFLVSLPFVFFEKRDGRLNPMWWATAAPFVVCPGLVVASELGLMPLFVSPDGGLGGGLTLFGVLLSASSIALVAFTLGNHQAPLSQWHQENDAPRELVTHGAYSRIRHPFYAAYLLAFLAAVSICPTAGTVGVLIYAAFILNHTAAREEQRLRASTFGIQYCAYRARTGRFLPRMRRRPA